LNAPYKPSQTFEIDYAVIRLNECYLDFVYYTGRCRRFITRQMASSEGETGSDVTHRYGTASATVEGN